MVHNVDIAGLGPVVALAIWTHVMGFWMLVTRVPAIASIKMRLDSAAPRGAQMNSLPPRVRWKADNYNHLMEQPTVFYAVAIALAIAAPTRSNLVLAWAYVALRVVHSIWQATVNYIPVRFLVFLTSTLVLIAMTVRAAIAIFGS